MEQMDTEPTVSSSDDDDSSFDDEEEQTLKRVEELERQLSDNKYLYDIHVELVELYRKLGDLKSMRAAYERFHEYYPLTPEIWLAWINDEKKIATSDSDNKYILKLFDLAVEDYASVALWQEYAQYSIGASDLETTRAILERGLTAVGLNTAEGILLWDTLRELELAHLSLTEQGTPAWKESVTRVANIFKRQLSVPLIGIENTYAEWQDWYNNLAEGHGVDSKLVNWGYEKALKTLETFKPFEDNILVTQDENKLYCTFKDYLKFLSDPSTVVCVFERAVTRLCLNPNIWLDYCMYALKLGDMVDKISNRALRNCPWSEELWIMRLKILEYLQKDNKEVMSCFESAMAVMTSSQGLELWLAYLEYVSRTSDDKQKLYKVFDQAIEQLSYNGDKVAKWYARILAKNGDMVSARRKWKTILKGPQNKTAASLWLEFAALERQYGDNSQVRGIFQRALTSCTDWPQYIADEWMMFERQFGSLQDVLKCMETCKEALAKIPEIVQIQPEQPSSDQKGKKRKHPHQQQESAEIEVKKSKFEEHKPRKVSVVKDPTKTVFVSNLYPSVDDKALKKVFPNALNIELVYDRQGRSRCYGYVQFEMEEEVAHALARDRELLNGRPVFISACKPDRSERKAAFKYSQDAESNKLFIRGLPLDHTQEDVEAIFKQFNCKDVRLVRQKSGQSKGLAYVEFENQSAAKEALKHTDQMKIGDKVISVAISAPPLKSTTVQTTKSSKEEPVRHARSRLQIPLLPRALQIKTNSEASSGPNDDKKSKNNEDFRKMLFKKSNL